METVRLSDVELVQCYQRSAPFVPISSQLKLVKPCYKKGPFYVSQLLYKSPMKFLHSTKITASKAMVDKFTTLMGKVDTMSL